MRLTRIRSSSRPTPPPRIWRKRPWREVGFVSLDFETTGLDHRHDAIVSFGAVPIRDGRIVLGEAVHRLVSPGVPVSSGSMKVHGILPQDLDGAPSIIEAGAELSRALDGAFLVAWFAQVEMMFLARTFGGSERWWARRTIDARQMALFLEGRDQATRHTLSGTAARYGVPVTSPHEALDDALVTAQLFLILSSRMEAAGRGRACDLLALTRPHG